MDSVVVAEQRPVNFQVIISVCGKIEISNGKLKDESVLRELEDKKEWRLIARLTPAYTYFEIIRPIRRMAVVDCM